MNLTTYCTICKSVIPEKRAAKRSVLCEDKECRKRLNEIRRFRTDMRRCRACAKPSTPEERKAFKRWRKTDPEWKGKK